MRLLMLIGCLFFVACGNDPADEKVASTNKSTVTTQQLQTTTGDTGKSSQDTATPLPPPVVVLTKPSGIYQFLFSYNDEVNILHTIAFYPAGFRLQEEYLDKKDSISITTGTWSPSQGFIWLYKDQLVRGRYSWKGDTLQYFSPRLNKKFSLSKLTPITNNASWMTKAREGSLLYGIGTEPFWSVELNKNKELILNMPDWTEPLMAPVSTMERYKDSTVYWAATDSLRLTVYPLFCSDGMSDFTYSNKIVMLYKGQQFKGCAATLQAN